MELTIDQLAEKIEQLERRIVILESPDKDKILMEEFRDKVKEGKFDGKTMREICKDLGMTYRHFRYVFTNRYKMSPAEYIRNHKLEQSREIIEKAKEMLSGDFRVNEVSQKLGFNYASDFCNHFKRIEGVTPKKYQLSLMKEDI